MLRQTIANYLTELKLLGKSRYTVTNYAKHLEKFVAWCEQNGVDFRQANGKESREFRNHLVRMGLAPKTVNTILGAVKGFYDFACEEGLVKGNPMIMKRLRVAEPKALPQPLTEEEEDAVLRALQSLPGHIGLAFKTMLVAGLRVGEAANLKPEDVMLCQGAVFLRVRHGKGNKERRAPVTDAEVGRALLDLAAERKGEARLFGVTDGTLKVYAHSLKKLTGVDFHSHRMRHTLATRLLAQGTPIDVVQEVLGHESINTTRRYAKTASEALLKVAARVE